MAPRWFSVNAGLFAFSAHSAFIFLLALFINSNLDPDHESLLLWNLCWLADFPSSIFVGAMEALFSRSLINSFGVRNFDMYFFAISFGILGGCQYFLLVGLIFGLMRKKKDGTAVYDKSDDDSKKTL